MVSITQIAHHTGKSEQTIKRVYRDSEHNQVAFRDMQIGTFCDLHNITNGELEAFVEMRVAIKKRKATKSKGK